MHIPPENHKEREYHHRIRKVLAFIQENLSSELTLAGMAKVATISPFHFQRLFSRIIGESPKKYVLRLRLERAAHHLKIYPELSVFEISLQSGFSSPSTFGRAFKNFYGISPDEFRKLSHDEISKICTSKNKTGKEDGVDSRELWGVNYDEKEEKKTGLKSNIVVVKRSSLKVAFVDSHLGNTHSIANAFKTLYTIANPRELINSETRFIGIFFDLPFFTELNKCRFRACITLPSGSNVPKEVAVCEIPENRYAVYTIKGTFEETLQSLVAFKHQWLDHSGYQIAETIGYEEYSVNPATESFENTDRQLFIPVKPE
jgi:AraC family transcriptional regulator